MRVIDEYGLVWDESPYLSHHGIMGMRWGKRNGPPYPLAPSAHSQAEKRLRLVNEGELDSWKDEQSYKTNKRYDKRINRLEKKINKSTHDLMETLRKPNASDKAVAKKQAKIQKLVEKSIKTEAMKALEKVRVQKALYKENKKLAKQRLNEIKQQLKEEEKKVIDGYTREQIDSEKKRLGNDVYGSKANKYADKYPDVRKAKMEFDKRSDQVAKELEKKYPPNSEQSRRLGFDDPDTFWNEIKKDKELQRLEKEYHDTLRKHNVSDRQAVKSLKMASRASSMRSAGMSYAQIAKKLGIPESSVSYYLNM